MTDPGVPDLVEALRGLRDRFQCDATSATYISPDGVLVTVQITGALITIADDEGHVHAVELPEAGR